MLGSIVLGLAWTLAGVVGISGMLLGYYFHSDIHQSQPEKYLVTLQIDAEEDGFLCNQVNLHPFEMRDNAKVYSNYRSTLHFKANSEGKLVAELALGQYTVYPICSNGHEAYATQASTLTVRPERNLLKLEIVRDK